MNISTHNNAYAASFILLLVVSSAKIFLPTSTHGLTRLLVPYPVDFNGKYRVQKYFSYSCLGLKGSVTRVGSLFGKNFAALWELFYC